MTVADGIKKFVDENPQYKLYEGYSGRGMFGRKCLGVVVSHGDSFMEFLMNLTRYLEQNDIEDTNLDLEGVSYDDLGLDTIVYFVNIRG